MKLNEKNFPNYPIAHKKVSITEIHDIVLRDEYAWLRLSDEEKIEGENNLHTKKVVEYLNEENKYSSEVLAAHEKFELELYEEIKNRFVPVDLSVPYFENGYFYTRKYKEGKEYPIYNRQLGSLDADIDSLLNVNELAANHEYYDAKSLQVSPNNKILGFAEDTLSRRQYKLRFKDLTGNYFLEDEIENTTGSLIWSDNKTVFYSRKDESLRPSKIFRHIIGSNPSEDVLVYHEKDEAFYASVYKTNSERFIVMSLWSTVSQEYRILDTEKENADFVVFQPRKRNLEYYIDHCDNNWYIQTNKDGAKNFKIMRCDLQATTEANWKEFIEHKEDTLIEKIECFQKFLAVSQRRMGNTQIKILPWNNPTMAHEIDFSESSYFAFTSTNYNFQTDFLRLTYTSLITPMSTFDYYIESRKLVLKKQQEVLGGFEPENYRTEKIFAKARDGKDVPISIIYPKNYLESDNKPLLLYGYGSYGNSMDPYFSPARLSLLNRGMAFAIAHVRGGEELGREWYEDGKLLNKQNTFFDFIDCGKYLIDNDYVSDNQLFAMGGSAGGLLVGAAINMEPALWKGVIAAVPFVDVINTMLDESIPLTTGEFDEWGNPKIKEYFNYIMTYSPYDNVEKKGYPAMLVTTGYHDSQVQYWEPAKWVAKLRSYKTDSNILLLHTNMDTGHGGFSGRFRRYKETAKQYVFLLSIAELI